MGGFTVEEKEQLKALGFIIDPTPPLRMGRITVKEKKKMEILGLTIDPIGNWSQHIIQAILRCPQALGSNQKDEPHA